MKKNRLFNALVLAASLILLNTSCEIGLGASVDVQAPTLSITYPDQASVIRENFIIAGECDDDQGISKVNITVQRTDTGKSQTIKTVEASLNTLTGKWQASLNEYLGDGKGYNGWEFPDGKYVANVSAVDNSGRASGIASLTFDIDNTAPIFIIKSPTSKKIENPTSFGTSFKVTGTMTDDHTVSKMIVKVYDNNVSFDDPENPPVPMETVYESNIDTTTEVVIANRNREGNLKDRYEHFYEGTAEGKDRSLWCTVEMQDNAKIYRDPDEGENETIGNTTNEFYIVDDVNSVWSDSDREMDPGKVKKIVNRTATGIDSDLVAEVMDLFNNSAVTRAAFSINSDSNPTYEFRSFGTSAQNETISKNAAAEGSVSFSLTPGRNGDNVQPDTVKVYLWGPFDSLATTEQLNKMYSSSIDVMDSYAATLGTTKANVLLNNRTEKGSSATSYNQDLTLLDTIATKKYYYISAYAEDITGAVAKPTYDVFVFKGHSSGQPPVVKWDDNDVIKINGVTVKNDVKEDGITGYQADGITFAGYASYPDGLDATSKPTITYTATAKEVLDGSDRSVPGIVETTIPQTDISIDDANNIAYWTFTVPGLSETSNTVYNYTFTVTASSESDSDSKGFQTRRITMDTKKPDVEITSVYPTVEESLINCLNGTVKFDANIKDKNLKDVWYEVYSGSTKVVDAQHLNDVYTIKGEEIDTTKSFGGKTFTNNSDLIIKLYAIDQAGNQNETTSTIQNKDVAYKLKQETDKPVVTTSYDFDSNDKTLKTLSESAWYEGSAPVTFSITDDDGLAEAYIYIDSTASGDLIDNDGATTAPISYQLPSEDGVYTIKLVAKDTTYGSAATDAIKAYRNTTWGPYKFGIDTKSPEVSDSKAFSNNYASASIDLDGDAYDANGIKSITVEISQNGSVIKTINVPVSNVNTSTKKWSYKISLADNGIGEGKYTVSTTFKDYAGNSSVVESAWTVDKTPPTLSETKITTTPVSSDIYNTNKITISTKASDSPNEVREVVYSTDGSNWLPLTNSSGVWSSTVTLDQGTSNIQIKAVDDADLDSTVVTKTVKIDTIKPSTFDLTKIGDETNKDKFKETKMVSKTAVPFVVTVKDDAAGTGIKSVVAKVRKADGTYTSDITKTSSSGDSYTFTLSGSNLVTGSIVLVATDNAGNVATSSDLFKISSDTLAPIPTIGSILPVVTYNNAECLNGKVTVKGSITDENPTTVTIKCEVYESGKSAVVNTYTNKATAPSFEFEIDTTDSKFTNGTKYVLKVVATDKAGNGNGTKDSKNNDGTVSSAAFTVDQASDKPMLEPSNFKLYEYDSTKTENAIPKEEWFNASGNNKVIGSITDDDGLATATITVKKVNKDKSLTTKENAKALITAGTYPVTVNLNYPLPSEDGIYQLIFNLQDKTYGDTSVAAIQANRKVSYGPYIVGVDTKAPSITETHSEGTTYLKDEGLTLTGNVSDENGIRYIYIYKNNTLLHTIEEPSLSVSGSKSAGTWSYTIAKADLAEGSYTFKIIAEDSAGNTAQVERSFIKDKTNPSISNVTLSSATKVLNSTQNWYNTDSVSITLTATDTNSKVAKVEYSTDTGTTKTWTQFTQNAQTATTYTANVTLPSQGENKIYIRATDNAGNEGTITNGYTVVYVDNIDPDTCELVSIDGETNPDTNKLANGKSGITFVVKASDSGTGVAKVAVTQIGTNTGITTITAGAPTSGNYTLTIPGGTGTKITTGSVVVTVTDNIGNSKNYSVFSIKKDETAPSVTYNTIVDALVSSTDKVDVNGSLTVSGTASDESSLAEVKLYYAVNTKPTNLPTATAANTWTAVTVTGKQSWSGVIDTSAYDKKNLYVCAVAVDTAGNQKQLEYPKQLYINQDTDRPTISITNLAFTNKDTANGSWRHTEDILQGQVEDDDGTVKEVRYWDATKSAWSDNIYKKGTWIISGLTEGTNTIKFKVVDAADGTFESDGTKTPKIIDNAKTASETSSIKLTVDTNAPVFDDPECYVSSSSTYAAPSSWTGINSIGTVGGTNKYLFVKVTSSDANGINKVAITLDGGTPATISSTNSTVDDLSTNVSIFRFDLSALTLTANKAIEDKTLSVEITDNAGKSDDSSYSVTVDNVKPTVKFTTTQNQQYSGSGSNTIMGRSDDVSDIASLYYALTLTNSASDITNWTEVKSSAATDDISKTNWNLYFDSKETTNTEYHTTIMNDWIRAIDTGSTIDMDKAQSVDLYLWVKAVDNLGNETDVTALTTAQDVTVKQPFYMSVIPNASIPRISISYPDEGIPLGGTIRATGSVEIGGGDYVDRVYMQIDPDYRGTFNTNWESALTAVMKGSEYTIVDTQATNVSSAYSRGIRVNGTSSWSQVLNSRSELNDQVTIDGVLTNRTVAIRVFAIGHTDKRVSAPAIRTFEIDPNMPKFGDLEVDGLKDMYLVQYNSSSSIIARQKYSDDMNVKGKWYIRGSISDDSGISKAELIMPDSSTISLVDGTTVNSTYVTAHTTGTKNYIITIPVDSDVADEFGNLSYTINLEDNSTGSKKGSSSKIFKIRYDNRAPELTIADANKNSTDIYNSNGEYKIEGSVNETSSASASQSGFSSVVMYITNERGTGTNKTMIVDPMVSKGADNVSNRETVVGLTSADGMYWRSVALTSAHVVNGVMTSSAALTNVRPGTLCKVDGIIYLIKSVNDKVITLDDNSVDSTSASVLVSVGTMVIDGNRLTGEGLTETVQDNGATTNWSASIDSTEIYDGEVTVHFVAFDKAGNTATDSYTATVKNNAPRLAGVKFGSDMDYDGEISGDEWNLKLDEKYVGPKSAAEKEYGKDEAGRFKYNITQADIGTGYLPVKTGFKVIPQIVGGNKSLKTQMDYTASDDTEHSVVSQNYGTVAEAVGIRTGLADIAYSANDLLQLGSTKDSNKHKIKAGKQVLAFNVIDATEGTPLSATIQLPVNLMVEDSTAPAPKWLPLYWKSKSENSLYKNSQSNGHIELAEDWANNSKKASYKDSTGAVLDQTTAKVSGKITMKGEVRDNGLVNAIIITFSSTQMYKIERTGTAKVGSAWKTYYSTNGTAWTEQTSADLSASKFWDIKVTGDVIDYEEDENGDYGYNVVSYEFHWDTAKLLGSTTYTKKNVEIKVTATDLASKTVTSGAVAAKTANTSTAGTTNTTKANGGKDYYKFDVVPYVTKVKTELADLQSSESKWTITSRTSTGAYPVRVTTKEASGSGTSNETITLYGFNLGADSKTVTATSLTKSGEYNLLVGTIYAVNNYNDNNAKGEYTKTVAASKAAIGDKTVYENWYNRQPNGENNNNLNDDISFDVWEFNSRAVAPYMGKLEQPVMAINPNNGIIGFGFADGPAYFSMGNGTTNSYVQWTRTYDAFSSIAFAYDLSGNSYGTAAGGDISGNDGGGGLDNFSFYTSRMGPSECSLACSQVGANAARLEKIGQTDMSYTNKQRVKSPAIVTSTHGGNNTYVYVAYYDSINGEIRVRFGDVDNNDITTVKRTAYLWSNKDTTVLVSDDIADVSGDVTDSSPTDYTRVGKSLIATSSTTDKDGNTARAGEYMSIALISSQASTVDDVLGCIWYNPEDKTLWFSYNRTPYQSKSAAVSDSTGNRGYWTKPVRVFAEGSQMEYAGQYCKMVADTKKGFHIAAYDSENQDLCYAYIDMSSITTDDAVTTSMFKTGVVDSKDVVGTNLSIDVGLKNVGTAAAPSYVAVPSIGYYSTENVKPMYAYLNDTTAISTGKLDGAVNDMYTEVWDCSLVPTKETPSLQSKLYNMINVGLWKTKAASTTTPVVPAGTIKASTTGSTSGVVYGNGSSNAVLGYSIQNDVSTNVETAQKRSY